MKRSRIGSWMPRACKLIDQFLEVDGLLGLLVGMNGDVARLVDAEVALAPVANAVGFQGVGDLPLFHQFRLTAFRHRRGLHKERGTAGGRLAIEHLPYIIRRSPAIRRTAFPLNANFFTPKRCGCKSMVKNRRNAAGRTQRLFIMYERTLPTSSRFSQLEGRNSRKRRSFRRRRSTSCHRGLNRRAAVRRRCYPDSIPRSQPKRTTHGRSSASTPATLKLRGEHITLAQAVKTLASPTPADMRNASCVRETTRSTASQRRNPVASCARRLLRRRGRRTVDDHRLTDEPCADAVLLDLPCQVRGRAGRSSSISRPTWRMLLRLAWPVLLQQWLVISLPLVDSYLAGTCRRRMPRPR